MGVDQASGGVSALSDIGIDTNKNWGDYDITNLGDILPNRAFLPQLSSTPTDGEIGSGNTALYMKDDGNVYKKQYGGSELKLTDADGFDLSGLGIDVTKDWQGYNITNIGSIGYDLTSRLPALGNIGSMTENQSINGMKRLFHQNHVFDISYHVGPTHSETTPAFRDAALLPPPDGRVIFAPYSSDNVGIFDPSTDSYTSGPAHGLSSTSAFGGAVLVPDGRVVLVPRSGGEVGLFDPSTDSYTSGPSVGSFNTGTLVSDGRVIMAPRGSADIGIFDPSDDSYTAGPSHGEGDIAFSDAVLVPDGRVILTPYASENVGIFDPSDDSYTSGPAHGESGSYYFQDGVLLPDGRVAFVPAESGNVGIFDPSDDSYTSGPAHGETTSAFVGGSLMPDGRVIMSPENSANIGIFDPSDDSYTSGPSHSGGSNAYEGACLLVDGRVVFTPASATEVAMVRTYSQMKAPEVSSFHPFIS